MNAQQESRKSTPVESIKDVAPILRPVSGRERIDLLDVVRGFALFGVLLANLVWLTTDMVLTDRRAAGLPAASLDYIAKALVVVFVDGKFYTLFSFLFGVGFALQLSRAEGRGRRVTGLYARRVAVLMLIGVLHIALLWYGDILLAYGLLGFALLAVRRWNTRLLLVLAVCLALLPRAAVGIGRRLMSEPAPTASTVVNEDDVDKEHRLAIFDSASYSAIVRENIRIYYGDIVSAGVALFLFPQIFARFLLGLLVGRRRWFESTNDLVPAIRRLLPWSTTIGIVGNGFWLITQRLVDGRVVSHESYWMLASAPLVEAGILAMALTYLGLLVLAFHRSDAWKRRLGHLAPVGRMALTNYLTHSVLYLLFFTGVGFAWIGEVGPAICVALSLAIFALQVQFSGWWLERYQFGPAEWAWRTLTYGQRQSFSRHSSAGGSRIPTPRDPGRNRG